ncbi:MAG: hypothetical protein AAGC74_08325, partial [Verrucomicrobiota bacterium]
IVVVVFAMVVRAVPAMWGVSIVALGLGVGTVASIASAWVEWQAAGLVDKLTEARVVFNREEERVKVVRAMRGLAMQRVVPGVLGFLFSGRKGGRLKDGKALPD